MNQKDLVSILLLNKPNTTGKKHPVSNYNKEHYEKKEEGGLIFERKKDGAREDIKNLDIIIKDFKINQKNSMFKKGEN